MAGSTANRHGSSSGQSSSDSVTDLGEPGLVRAASIEIAQGTVLAGRYQIEATLGKGGSGIVLRAFDRVAQVPVAVKILKPELATDPRWVERFSRELRLARQIQHPHVCRVFDIGQADGHWFITMELATSGTLRDHLGPEAKRRTLAEKVADVRAVVDGLAAIHGAGIVHRDVKPDNFLRLADGRLVLSDFGLATNPSDAPVVSIMVGTPHYMAPEVVMGEVATCASDVWSAGVVIHEILSGERPDRKLVHRGEAPKVPASTPEAEARVLARLLPALAMEPEQRPANAAELAQLVERAVDPLARRTRSRRRAQVLWGATAVVMVAASVGLARRLWHPAEAFVAERAQVQQIQSTGEARDWGAGAKVLSAFEERVECFQVLPGGERARVIVGSPRRAEEIDLGSGKHFPSSLRPETYAVECPQLSPDGGTLLFTNVPRSSSPEIMRSKPDGTDATMVTTGRAPLWLPNGEEFVFELTDSHVGMFSLPTMRYTLLPDDRGQEKSYLYKKAVSPRGDLVAVTYQGRGPDRVLEVHALPELRTIGKWLLPNSVRGLDFSLDHLLLSNVAAGGVLESLDWRTGMSRRVGRVNGRVPQFVAALPNGDQLLVSTTKTSDVWLFDAAGKRPRQLTHDGRSYAASWSPTGRVLVETQLDDNRLVIFLYGADGHATQVTNGPFDLVPSFAGTTASWVYVDFSRKAIVRCWDAGNCVDVLQSNAIVQAPVMSPDERHIAYVAPFGVPRMHLVDASGKGDVDLGATAIECPAVWTSASSLWVFGGAGNLRRWEEIDVRDARKTGRVKEATTFSFNGDEQDCGWETRDAGSPFFQHARILPHDSWQATRASALAGLD
jgi:serine/threonine protein kinase